VLMVMVVVVSRCLWSAAPWWALWSLLQWWPWSWLHPTPGAVGVAQVAVHPSVSAPRMLNTHTS